MTIIFLLFVMAMIGHGQMLFSFYLFFSYGSDRPWTILILFYFDFFLILFLIVFTTISKEFTFGSAQDYFHF